ncbi:formyltransferase family protein [Sphingomonas arenae]|uniref:formyltransferase family protein n=1 Tax=Sphingomonas arenae TaxID=2812555 RepID=UPI0019689B0F|nr:formyltransferase family protein [Sphingomonas arenae]
MGCQLCVAGKNMIAVEALARLSADHDVVCLPNPEDQGVDGWQPSLRRAALQSGIPIVNEGEAAAKPELCFLSLEYSRIIRPDAFATDKLFNLHFSLLPKYRGCNTAVWPILHGEEEHGVTLHCIDAGVDTGPIIDQRAFPLGSMTAFGAYMECQRLGVELVLEWIPRLIGGDFQALAQGEGTSFARGSLDWALKEIDLSETREQVLRRLRAFTFPAYQLPTLRGKEITQWGTRPFHGATMVEAADGPLFLKLRQPDAS